MLKYEEKKLTKEAFCIIMHDLMYSGMENTTIQSLNPSQEHPDKHEVNSFPENLRHNWDFP